MSDTQEHKARGDRASGSNDGLSPEAYLLMLVLVGAGYVGVRYIGDYYGWWWPWLLLGGGVTALLLWYRFSTSPRQQRLRTKHRKLDAINREIKEYGATAERYRRFSEVFEYYEQLEQEEEPTRSWRHKRISWPRRVLRWIAIGLLIVLLVPMGIAFYGAMFLLPSAAVFMGAYLLVGLWALLPAVLVLPVGGWLVWWWVNRVPPSTAQVSGLVGAAGA